MKTRRIRPISICLFRSGNRILVATDFDAVKQDYFCRPLGGGIEFGESSRDAMLREIREELNVDIENLRLLGVVENLFVCEGQQGHEIVFIYDAEFVNTSLYEQDHIVGYEQEVDTQFTAQWQSVQEIRENQVRLVPEGLAELLTT